MFVERDSVMGFLPSTFGVSEIYILVGGISERGRAIDLRLDNRGPSHVTANPALV